MAKDQDDKAVDPDQEAQNQKPGGTDTLHAGEQNGGQVPMQPGQADAGGSGGQGGGSQGGGGQGNLKGGR
ncbi:MAG TPA: hypothetical protein VM536_00235 [Chloroflexia bacterium]|nr:hypothetical protein [Chloroflexia bacterium]